MWIIAGAQTLAEAIGNLKVAPHTLSKQTLKPNLKNRRRNRQAKPLAPPRQIFAASAIWGSG
jgi:hypothetical protein